MKKGKKGFDWYAARQRFSIRKFHFGAASVLLGVAIASLATGPLAQAEEIDLSTQPAVEVPVPETPPAELPVEVPEVPVEESLPSPEPEAPVLEAPVAPAEVVPEVTAEPVAPEAPAAPEVEVPVERQAGIVYHASYVEETTKEEVGKGKPQATIVTTTEEKASAEVNVTADYLPKGYELSDPAKTSVTATVHEGQANPVAFSVRPVAVPETKVVTEGYTGLRATVPPAADGQVDQPTDGADATTYKGAEHFKNYDAADLQKIKRQITWLDFSNRDGAWGDTLDTVAGMPALRVGSKYVKEITPGYRVEVTVKELRPFQATDVYKNRVEGTAHEGTYNPNAVNANLKTYAANKSEADYGNDARIVAAPQDTYSNAKRQGLDITGDVTLRSYADGGNVGVKFETKAYYLNNEIPINVVLMSGEESGDSEIEIYTTNGENFELFGELSNDSTVTSYKPKGIVGSSGIYGHINYMAEERSHLSQEWYDFYEPKYWVNEATDSSWETAVQKAAVATEGGLRVVDGIGTKVFGPVSNHIDTGHSTPIIMTKNASEVGVYIAATGRQSTMIGVALLDHGDAPESYGSGAHSISLSAAEKQPYLGKVMGDIDFIPEGIPPGSVPWYRDELINQFDEGPAQLMGDDVEAGTNYTLHHADNGSYELKFIANTNGHAEAYVQGWIDFNNDGKFDDSENSGLIRIVNGKEQYTLNFNDIYQNVDPVVTKLGVRMRIALDAVDIITPDLTAYSGEVEDFQIQMTHPPRGSLTESRGEQGQTQTGVVNFFAYGENRYSTTPAKIDQKVAPQIVKADGTLVADTDLDSEGYYVVAGEGKYKLTGAGDNVSVEFIPEAGFITEYADGSKIDPDGNPLKVAKGISIRRSSTVKDAHDVAYTTGWHAKTEQNNLENVSPDVTLAGQPAGTMDGRFVPHVVAVRPTATPAVSTGVQGAIQTGTPIFTSGDENVKMGHTPEGGGIYPIKLIDETNTEADTAKAYAIVDGAKTEVGTYTVDGSTGTVTFTPNDAGKKYIGVVDPATVIAKDTNGSSVSTTYTPTITPITPTAQAATTVNLQGKTQEAAVTFTADNANITVSFVKSAAVPADQSTVGDLLPDTVTLLDENGNKVDKVEGPHGTYELDKKADVITITFTPKPDFFGTATPVRVQVEDSNGTAVETSYTPVVVQVRPTAEQDETYAVKNTPQKSTTDFFKPGQLDLNGDGDYDSVKETVALDPSTLKLIDGEQEVTSLTIDGQGTYTLNPNGSVTFKPVTDYVGDVIPVTIRIKDVNGTSVETTYTPHIIDVPEKELTTTVKRTINYVYADNSPVKVDKDGAPVAPLEHTVTFTRTAIADPETGEISYTEWTPVGDTTTFPEVTSPQLNNFTPDKAVVPADKTVSGDDADETITVIYRENDKQLATITYKAKVGTETVELSKEGAEGHPRDAIDFPNSPQKIADFEKLGYMVESNAFADATDPTFDDQPGVQNFDVILVPKTTTIKPQDPSDPDNPTNPKPGEPANPGRDDSPTWDAVTKSITRTIEYRKDSPEGELITGETHTDTVTYERTGTYNFVTNTISYTPWTLKEGTDADLSGKALPKIDGYVAVSATKNGTAVEPVATTETITVDEAGVRVDVQDDIKEIVVYKPLSNWTITPPPGNDPVPPIPYDNHPTDPTKPAEPTPTPAIPKVDGYVPVGPDGNELPKDPDGNYIPPVPTDPTQPTVITYKALEQKAVIQYLEEGSNKVLSPADEVKGKSGEPIEYSTAETIALIKERGYELVQDNFPTNATFDRNTTSPQVYTVVFREKVVTTTPDNPQTPGTPVDPTNPDGPRWEEVTKTITRTVAYKLDTVDGQPAPTTESKTNSVTFERTGSYNHVTKQVIYTDWVAKDGDSTLEGQTLPLVTGYVAVTATRNSQTVTPSATAEAIEASATTDNVDEIVVYKALSSWTVTPPPGTDPVPPIPYDNHPTDPTKPADPTPTPAIPKVDGYVPVGPDGNELPKDPDGNYIPPVPTDPTQPTVITYKALEQKAVIQYLEEGSNKVLSPADEVKGKSGEPIDYSTAETIALIVERGYELVQDNFPTNATYDRDTTSPQVYTVVFREKVVTTTPDNPQTPGTPVDPTNPDGPKWPDGLKESDLNQTVTRTIKYQYEDGSEAQPDVVETLIYKRTATVNLVTKVVTYGNWTSIDDDFDKVDTPAIVGYTPDKASVAAVQDVPATAIDTEVTITYVKDVQKATITYQDENGQQLGGIDEVTGKSGEPINYTTTARITELINQGYEVVTDGFTKEGGQVFDTDKDTPQTFTVVVKAKVVSITPDTPQTPGTPVDPNNPDGPKWPDGLKENDLNKTVIRTILYKYENETSVLAEDGSPRIVKQVVNFQRTARVNIVTGSVTYGEWSESKTVPAVDSPVIKGYITDTSVVPALTITANDNDQTITVVYREIGSWVPNIPGQPETPIPYPNHPTDPTKPGDEVPTLPHVPGFIPVGPDGVTPLPPVDPDDPSKGYELPPIPTDPGVDTPITYVPEAPKSSTVTVKYVDESGKDLLPPIVTEGKVGDSYTSEGKVIKGYLLKEVPSNATGTMVEGGTVVTYVYVPIGSWIPNIPGQPVTPIPYPNHPTDPTKPGDEVPTLPHVPGFIPVGPDGVTPLPPVDPDDPSKGYELPPIPTDPGVDTPISYVPEAPKSTMVTVKYMDESGKDLLPPIVTEGKVGDSYTSEGKVIKGYLLKEVPSNATGTMVEGGTVVTYVYVPIGSWIPNIPGQPVTPIPYPNHPTDPTKPGDEVPTLPHVPGFIPVGPDGVPPLPPVDPDDPSKGYELPPIPTDPGVDTPINYVPEAPKSTTVSVKYVDESGKDLLPPVITEGKVGDSYTSEGKVIKGYLLKEVPSNATGTMVEGGTVVTYVYVPIGSWVPNIPGQPVTPIPYPNHPTDPTKPGNEVPTLPHVPGFIPVGPDGVTPLPPVDPDDPNKGYELPPIPTDPGVDTPINYVPEAPKSTTVTVKYVDKSGKDLLPPVITEGKVGDSYTSEGKVIKGYLLKEVPSNATGTMVVGGTVVTYVYVPIGSWVPNIPGHPVTPIPYPNHPTDPTKPGDEVPTLPHVPGFIPVGPDGVTPLPPVDPDDPTKGYIAPPVPSNPGEDTPINYVPVKPGTPGTPVTPTKSVTPTPDKPVEPEVSVKPTEPAQPVAPGAPSQPADAEKPASLAQQQLPNTGEDSSAATGIIGATMLLGTFAYTAKRRRKED
ncbi:TPA: MucBP domain-containing protein [Streptococcus suis]|nr:MucBP domain-containing protein [Streptococcus suis]HEM6319293.1 MucBP domain-containing protein [Streptococcus suis]